MKKTITALLSSITKQTLILSSFCVLAAFFITYFAGISYIARDICFGIILTLFILIYIDSSKESKSILYKISDKLNFFIVLVVSIALNAYLSNYKLSGELVTEQFKDQVSLILIISLMFLLLIPIKYCKSSIYCAIKKSVNETMPTKLFNYLLLQAEATGENGALLMKIACNNNRTDLALNVLKRFNKYRQTDLAAEVLLEEINNNKVFGDNLNKSKELIELQSLCSLK